jgi:hypothetical protein
MYELLVDRSGVGTDVASEETLSVADLSWEGGWSDTIRKPEASTSSKADSEPLSRDTDKKTAANITRTKSAIRTGRNTFIGLSYDPIEAL